MADELFCLRQLAEKQREWNRPLCALKSDVLKAFDTIDLRYVWPTLIASGMPRPVARAVFRELVERRVQFSLCGSEISSGWTSIGDPLSALLFTARLNRLLAPLVANWAKRGLGVQLDPYLHGPLRTLSLLRFADDIIMVASCLRDLKQMTEELRVALRKAGLLLSPEKCK